MTQSGQGPDLNDPPRLVLHLVELAETTDENDLAGLAKMHGLCEAICGAGAPDGDSSVVVLGQVRWLLGALESVILDEADDAARVCEEIIDRVRELAELFADVPDEVPPANDAPPLQDETDEEIEAKLARCFEDEPLPARPPAVPVESCRNDAIPVSVPDTQAAADVDALPTYEQEPLLIKREELDFVKGFTDEAGEHIEAIEASVLEVEADPNDKDKINDLFRPFHTIKGISGFLNLRDINALTHETETLLDQGRKGQRELTPDLIDVVFSVVDILKAQIAAVAEWVASPADEPVPQPPVSEIIDTLRRLVAGQDAPGAGPTSANTGQSPVQPQRVSAPSVSDPLSELESSDAGSDHPAERSSEAAPAVNTAEPPATQPAPGAPASANGRSLQSTMGDQTIRIDTAKLDALVDMVGELVISQTLVNASPQISTDAKLAKNVGQVSKIVREVQQVAMAMRMVPIGPTFQKMARLVRDVSRKAGKQVRLTISGEDTELDKTVIQQIGDPLVHMIRNAIDHGIEPPEQRRAIGKSEAGEVHLGARHQGGNIIIEIRDDGKGLDAQALIEKGIERGVIRAGEELSDQQAYALIFASGFSMAKQVTDISGRGVGMDVVKRAIEQLRGKVEITSELGRGSTFSIHLPLTLAIIDGMIIRIGGERFILPTIAIEQSLRPLRRQISTVQQRGEILSVRGQLVPLIQLGELFGLTRHVDPSEAMVVIAHCEGRQVGLVVEELIGQQQVVIKSLGQRFKALQGISGAAILGDGRVGLILETPGLAALHHACVTSDHQHDRTLPHSLQDATVSKVTLETAGV